MRRIFTFLYLTFFCLGFTFGAKAENAEAEWEWLGSDGLLFLGGVISGIATHEAGHIISALAYGGYGFRMIPSMQLSYVLPHKFAGSSKEEIAVQVEKLRQQATVVGLAGFGAEVLSSNVILFVPQIPKSHPFVIGWLGFNIVNPIIYTVANELLRYDGGHGDLRYFTTSEDKSISYITEGALIVHSVLSAYRLFMDPSFPLIVKADQNGFQVSMKAKF